ncbi:MAG: glutamine--fructose-6-phosphate transaminase (isomerizing) [Acutalibacteraceae bacterium]
MCGIIGYVGYDNATPLLLSGLKKLEYRGYDSAGVAVHTGKELKVVKTSGKLQALSEKLNEGINLTGNLGIGHTRWATHGEPSEENAHPQVSMSGKFAVVHNGIIENYLSVKEKLLNAGVEFTSDTDSEVIAQFLEFYYDGNILNTMSKLLKKIEGSYSLGIVCADKPDELIAAKKASPLIIGVGKNENFIASDVTAIVSRTKDIIRLEDEEFAIIKENNIKIYDKNKNIISKDVFHIDWDISVAEKSGYEHFMLKEIMEQPKAIMDTINPRIKDGKIIFDGVNFSKDELTNISKICILACGSAYHAGYAAKYIFEKLLRKPVELEVASEFRYMQPIIDENVLVLTISQSGETADTLAALKEAKKLGAKVLSIVNVVGSSIANESDNVIYTWAGPEIAVATTKAYSTQLSVIYMLAVYMADKLGKINHEQYDAYINDLLCLPSKIEEVLKNQDKIKAFAEKFYNCKNVFFIGRNTDYAVSLEGSLKLKEISYIHSEAYPAGELKHGTISLIEENTLVVALATNDTLFEKMVSNVKEVKARGAVVLTLTTEEHKGIESISDFVIFIPKISDIMMPSLSVIPLQLFSYYIAYLKNCDIDKPRNLAKSVTVE